MSTTQQLASYHDMFVAVASSAASLTGLIFVAVSINLEKIMSSERLPARAGESLGVLLTVLISAVLLLAPHPSRGLLGGELLAIGVVLAVGFARSPSYRGRPAGMPVSWVLVPICVGTLSTLPLLVAGVLAATGLGDALSWMVAEFVLGIAGAVYNAWILLVEIHR